MSMSTFLFGRKSPPAAKVPAAASAPAAEAPIKIKDVLGDPPEFERVYKVAVPRGITMVVTIKTFCGSRFYSGELDQSNGKWVLFDPKDPADKILDREILPDVQRRCAEIMRLDGAFLASDPKQFTDSKGNTWIRQ